MRQLKAFLRNLLNGTLKIISGNGLDWFPIRKELSGYNGNRFHHDARASVTSAATRTELAPGREWAERRADDRRADGRDGVCRPAAA